MICGLFLALSAVRIGKYLKAYLMPSLKPRYLKHLSRFRTTFDCFLRLFHATPSSLYRLMSSSCQRVS
jgi:hypothetical protein